MLSTILSIKLSYDLWNIGNYPKSQYKNHELEENIKKLSKKMGISKPIEVFNDPKLHPAEMRAIGANLFSYKAGIAVTNDHNNKKDDLLGMAHEIAHIKNNDNFCGNILPIIVAVSSTTLFSQFLDFTIADILGAQMGILCHGVYSIYAEYRADSIACKYTNNNEKELAIRNFKKRLKSNQKFRNKNEISYLDRVFRKLQFSEEGNDRFDWQHPSITSRIKKIQLSKK